jgi:tRNA dimethylallyltransferase
MEGFDDIPVVPDDITERWTKVWESHGIAPLIESLKKLDPVYFNNADLANHTRLIRALAVCESSGKPFSSFRKGKRTERHFKVVPIVLTMPREELYARIDQRVLTMMESGWPEEAKSLYPYRHLKALQTIGYKELFDWIDDTITLPEAIVAIRQSTRRYAKRQMTWWRHQGRWEEFSPDPYESIIKTIDAVIGHKGGS